MSKRPTVTFITALVLFSVAHAQIHKGVNFQGVIKNPNGTYPNVAGTNATLKILSPNNCILWEEQHSGVNVTDGYINLVVGKGAIGSHQPAGQTFQKVYDNATTQTGLTCLNLDGTINGAVTSYAPTAQDARKLRLEMTLPDGPILADFNMRAMPFAVAAENAEIAKKVGTKAEADLIAVNSGAGLTQANLEEFIQSLTSVSGHSVRWNGANFISYDPADGANLSTGSVPSSAISSLAWAKLTGVPSPLADIGALACVDGKILKKVSGAWVCSDESGVGTEVDPTVQTFAKNAPGTGLTVNGSNAIVPDFGTGAGKVVEGNDTRLSDSRAPTGVAGGDLGGNYPSPTLAKIAGTNLSIAALSNGQVLKYDGTNWVNAADDDADSLGGLSCSNGDVALYNGSWTCVNASVASSNNSLVRRNGAGQIQTASADLGLLLLNNGAASTVTIQTPVAFTSYALTLPSDDGDNGQVLTSDGTGGLSWTSPMVASDYLTKAGNLSGLASAATSRTNLGITSTGDSLVTATSAANARSAINALSDTDPRLAPTPTGNGTNYIRVNSGGTAYEARTPANVLSDIGAMAAVTPGTSGNVLTSNGAAWTSAPLSLSANGFAAQNANKVLAGPSSGGDAVPTFRTLVADDIPNLDGGKITTGTVAATRLPAASGTADGIVNQIAQSFAGAKNFLGGITTTSVAATSVSADSVSTVNGVKIGTGATTCDGTAEGTVRYNGTSKKIELCNGSTWFVVGSGAGGGGGCPTNYIPVPALAPYTTQDFCVAKYEMKSVGATASSLAAKSPWVSISRDESVMRCQLLGPGYRLISNAEWQTIARNIETVNSNWSGGTAGSGALNRGHSDNAPAAALVADAVDNNACAGTGQTCDGSTWNQQRRTHTLTNGQVIWDFAGNVWEWTNDDYADLGVNPAISAAWQELSGLSATNKALFSSANGAWNSTQGLGQIYGSSAGAVLRGGNWTNGASAGVFTANLYHAPSATYTDVGFRCVFVP